jgi:hypothetical protein
MSAKPPKVEVAGEAIVNPFRVRTATVAVMSRSAATFTLRLAAVMLVTETKGRMNAISDASSVVNIFRWKAGSG